MIVKYIRNNKRIPSGVVVVMRNDNNEIKFGWSLHRKDDGHFIKSRGLNIAIGRAKNGTDELMPMTVARVLQDSNFIDRCKKYFKQNNLM